MMSAEQFIDFMPQLVGKALAELDTQINTYFLGRRKKKKSLFTLCEQADLKKSFVNCDAVSILPSLFVSTSQFVLKIT